MNLSRLIKLCIGAMVLQTSAACAQSPSPEPDTVRETGQGQVDFSSDQIHQLSGIAHFGADLFAVVSDKGGILAMATIKIDLETGEITHASIGQKIQLEGGKDIEDLAIDPSTCLLITVDEADQSMAYHHFPSGDRVEGIKVPQIFKQARPNLGFESVSASLYTGQVWTANEEPLKTDGSRATKDAGGLIRLQQFNHQLIATAQFAYRIDPHRGKDNIIERAQSGVSGLLTLPDGGVVVMERELGGDVLPTFRIRLYIIDTTDATDTSKLPGLAGQDIQPVAKTLLYEFNAGPTNFEGITLGPQLDNGDYTLILVSDDGGGEGLNPQRLLSLRIAQDLVESMPQKTGDRSPREPRRQSDVAGNLVDPKVTTAHDGDPDLERLNE